MLSIIIVNWNTCSHLMSCITALRVERLDSHEIIVVDNGSTDGSAETVHGRFPEVRLVRNIENVLFTRAINQGIEASLGRYILLLNSDTVVHSGSVKSMMEVLDRCTDIDAVCPMLVNNEGHTIRACMNFPTIWVPLFYHTTLGKLFPRNSTMRKYYLTDWDHSDSRYVEQPPAACLMFRRTLIDEVGLFDERMALYYSDVDFCHRIKKAGRKIYYNSDAKVFHHVGASTEALPDAVEYYHKDRIIYYWKVFGKLGSFVCKLSIIDLAVQEAIKTYRRVGISRGLKDSVVDLASKAGRCMRHGIHDVTRR